MSKNRLTWISLWTVYLIWGSTYFAIAYVIETMPPVLGMGARFLAAALILALFITFRSGAKELRDRKSTRLNSSHVSESRMPSSA